MDQFEALREQLRALLTGGNAHVDFDGAIADLPEQLRGASHPSIPYTPWRLLEHLRIAQRDILQFCLDPTHISPEWPEGYWPKGDAPPDSSAWNESVEAFRADLDAMIALSTSPDTDLFARLPHGDGQNVLREALLVADHNAYHLGQLVVLRRLLDAWHD